MRAPKRPPSSLRVETHLQEGSRLGYCRQRISATTCDFRCEAGVETIQRALVGNYQPEHVFALAQALAMYDAYQAQLDIYDKQITQSLPKPSQQKPQPSELNRPGISGGSLV